MSDNNLFLKVGLCLSVSYSIYLTVKISEHATIYKYLSNRILTLESKSRKMKYDISVLNSLIKAEKEKSEN